MKACGANVFATDAILSCIAAAPRSVYSWDLVIERIGGAPPRAVPRPRSRTLWI